MQCHAAVSRCQGCERTQPISAEGALTVIPQNDLSFEISIGLFRPVFSRQSFSLVYFVVKKNNAVCTGMKWPLFLFVFLIHD